MDGSGVMEVKAAMGPHWPLWDLIIRFVKSHGSWDAA